MDPCVQHGEHGIMFTTLKVNTAVIPSALWNYPWATLESLSSSRRRATIRSSTRRSHNTHKTIWWCCGMTDKHTSQSQCSIWSGEPVVFSVQDTWPEEGDAIGWALIVTEKGPVYVQGAWIWVRFLFCFKPFSSLPLLRFLKCFHSITVLNDSVFFI